MKSSLLNYHPWFPSCFGARNSPRLRAALAYDLLVSMPGVSNADRGELQEPFQNPWRHGEQFGEHDVFNHGFSLYAQEVRGPLLIISRATPADRVVSQPVSLRDLPATVVDLAGLDSPAVLPGRSLAEFWRSGPEAAKSQASPAVSEVDVPLEIGPERGRGPAQRGFTMSMVRAAMHYIVDIRGTEQLYDIGVDPRELRNLKDDPGQKETLDRFYHAKA